MRPRALWRDPLRWLAYPWNVDAAANDNQWKFASGYDRARFRRRS